MATGVTTIKLFTDSTGRLEGINTDKGSTPLQDLDYQFDHLGNLTQRRDDEQNLTENFIYDKLNRVTSIETLYLGWSGNKHYPLRSRTMRVATS